MTYTKKNGHAAHFVLAVSLSMSYLLIEDQPLFQAINAKNQITTNRTALGEPTQSLQIAMQNPVHLSNTNKSKPMQDNVTVKIHSKLHKLSFTTHTKEETCLLSGCHNCLVCKPPP